MIVGFSWLYYVEMWLW